MVLESRVFFFSRNSAETEERERGMEREDDENKTGFPFPGSVRKDGEAEFYSKAYDVNQVIITVVFSS